MNPDLLSAVLAAPEEDTPRLIYADWLDEHGDSFRAEFIRLQIEIARNPPLPGRTHNTALLNFISRERVLLHKHGEEWIAPFRKKGEPLHNLSSHGIFVRGFIEIVWMTAATFLKRGPALFQRTPLRELRVTRASELELQGLFSFDTTSRLKTLDLSGRQLGDRGASLFFEADKLSSIQCLRLCNCGISDQGASELADCWFDWPLIELDVTGNPLSAASIRQLRQRFGPAVKFHE